ncbi:hypothetical protein BGZ72_002125 [Mortierella alpina]|nr:hypothetical protein BGZ72_002125 [Mortierella alpina]
MTAPPSSGSMQHPEITIPGLGAVKGVLDTVHPVARFLNIPFGVVNERWRPADKAGPWQGVRDGTTKGYTPPQSTATDPFVSMIFGIASKIVYERDMSERDCLSLNIYMPVSALDSDEELPVCVWIYGGGLKNGSITHPLYDCTELVSTSIEQNTPMIVVSINYRVNFFGFISSKELALDAQTYAEAVPEPQRRWYDASVGNWGLLDQILGLEWIRDHIRAFRGDPSRVTVMGESAGAVAISCLQLIPECRGLFYRAILQSCAASSLPMLHPEHDGQRYFDHLCQVFGVPSELPPLEKVKRLRAIPERKLAEELNKRGILFFGPSMDGVLFKKDSRLLTQDASLYDPNLNWVVLGTCADEGTMFTALFNATTPQNIAKLRARLCAPGDGPVFDKLFGVPRNYEDAFAMGDRLLNSCLFKYPVLQASEAILAHPTCQLTRYHVDLRSTQMDEMLPNLKSHHGIELFYTFGNKTAANVLSDKEMPFCKEMQRVWIDVVTAKSPEGSSLPKVNNVLPVPAPAEDELGEEAIVFGADFKVGRGVVERMSAEEVEFWRRSFVYAAEQSRIGRGAEVGFDIFKSL